MFLLHENFATLKILREMRTVRARKSACCVDLWKGSVFFGETRGNAVFTVKWEQRLHC